MGNTYQTILDFEISPAEARERAEHIRTWMIEKKVLLSELSDCTLGEEGGYPPGPEYYQVTEGRSELLARLNINGVEFGTQREYAYCMSDQQTIECSHCGVISEMPEECYEGIQRWIEGEDEILISCPSCKTTKPYNEWKFNPPLGLGYLRITFWNWPPLKESFLKSIQEQFGLTTIMTYGKI